MDCRLAPGVQDHRVTLALQWTSIRRAALLVDWNGEMVYLQGCSSMSRTFYWWPISKNRPLRGPCLRAGKHPRVWPVSHQHANLGESDVGRFHTGPKICSRGNPRAGAGEGQLVSLAIHRKLACWSICLQPWGRRRTRPLRLHLPTLRQMAKPLKRPLRSPKRRRRRLPNL